jgi:hypothetical protein
VFQYTKLLGSIDEIKRPFASKESSDKRLKVSNVLSECEDIENLLILQIFWDFFLLHDDFLAKFFFILRLFLYLCIINIKV